ncbi:DUF4344 domain-containing metallopeptidase [Marinomonas sp. THO17]|uniref:DUF4344 domain-containing metallopeptidase n=1 Tax=Marinomonas sp. THO17 TaxID=3149048 RepID=UPI00336BC407
MTRLFVHSLMLIPLFFSVQSTYAANVTFTLEDAKQVEEKKILANLKDRQWFAQMSAIIDQHFHFNEAVKIVFGSDEGPLFDPQDNSILIPYAFIVGAEYYFRKNAYQKEYGVDSTEAAIHTLIHTLFHELAHAYILDQDIAILGKEEDAADNLATLLILENFDQGDSIAISAADMFAFESEDGPEYYDSLDYIGEHSFDLQRYFSTLCLVYGANPKKHPDLLNEVDVEAVAERQEYCQYYFETVQINWHRHLK